MIPSGKSLMGDVYGGLTAAVVALPLALAFGVASGVGPVAGLYGAIAVGFFAAVFGGTGSQVSGPTGPMTVVMGAIVTQFADNLPDAFAIVILGGMLQILFGLLRVGRYVSYTPYSVVSGFMSGIGVIIVLIQVRPFAGLGSVPGGPLANIRVWPEMLTEANTDALLIAVASLAIMIFWPARLHACAPICLRRWPRWLSARYWVFSCCRLRRSSAQCRPVCLTYIFPLCRWSACRRCSSRR
jgi:SulP family sulfate permease